MGAPDGAGAGRPESRAVARRHPVPGSGAGGAQSGVMGRRVSGGASTPAPKSTEEALSCIQQHVDALPPGGFHSGAARPRGGAAAAQAAAGPVRAAVADARLRAARAAVSRVPGDLVARGARLLPQVHGRRAHAADDPQLRAAREHRRAVPPALQDGRRGHCRRRNCSCCRCCCTTSASGATTSTRSRASAWRSTRSTGCRWRARRARRSCS